jgi:HK97 family phage major capsid protein
MNHHKTIGEAFVNSPEFKALRKKGTQGSFTTGPVEIEGKAVLDSTAVGSDATGLIQVDVQPGVVDQVTYAPRFSNLIPDGNTSSPLVRAFVLNQVDNETTVVNESAQGAESGTDVKPESGLAFNATDEPVKKFATFIPTTDEMLEDVPGLKSLLDGPMAALVRGAEEERQLLVGNGGDELVGLLNRSGVDAAPAPDTDNPNGIDALLVAIVTLLSNSNGLPIEPTAVVVNNLDWAKLMLTKDEAGSYILGEPGEQDGRTLFGVPVVISQALEQGTAIVGDFRWCQKFARGPITLEFSNSHDDYFMKDKVAIRVEERMAFCVYRPDAFVTVDLSAYLGS